MTHANEIKQQVQDKYNALARAGQSCCGTSSDCTFVGDDYIQLDGYVQDADLGLGCGLPTQFAGIKPGDTVVDLGSGAGNDVFVARSEAGDSGRVIGIDMADDMIARARQNLATLGYTNVEFRHGDIEDIPLPDNTADVVVSNCVLNLVPDKARAYAETFRILKPGGHFSISDVVIIGALPDALRNAAEVYVGCVGGAISQEDYLNIIRSAGFADVTVRKAREIALTDALLDQYVSAAQKTSLRDSGVGIYSITVSGTKPAKGCCSGNCCS